MRANTPGPEIAELVQLAVRHAATGAAAGRLTETVVEGARSARLFKLFLPGELGGLGQGLPDACRTLAVLARADPALGWAVMIGAGPNWFAGHMAPELCEVVFGPPDSCVAGSGTQAAALGVTGGWEISGTWRWCSGAPWATWFTLGAHDHGRPFVVAVPATAVDLDLASWDSRGLAATASIDVTLPPTFVPAAQAFEVADVPARPEPLFRVPFGSFAEATMAAVAVGTTARVLEEFATLAATKVPAMATEPLAGQPVVADRYARAVAQARAAASWLTEEVERLWQACQAVAGAVDPAGGDRERLVAHRLGAIHGPAKPSPSLAGGTSALDEEVITAHRLAALHAVSVAGSVADLLRPFTGMSALPTGSTIGRLLADARAIAHNAVVSEARFAGCGAALMARSQPPLRP